MGARRGGGRVRAPAPSRPREPRLPASRPISGENGRSGLAQRGRWGRVTCVHTVGWSCARAVVKSASDGPFSEASSEKLRNTASVPGHAVKTHSRPLFGRFKEQREPERACLSVRWSNERSPRCPWKCSIRTRCHHRTVVESNHRVSGEFPLLKPSPMRSHFRRLQKWMFRRRVRAVETSE